MNIIISVHNLGLGGVQTFVLRLANALKVRNKVYIYNYNYEIINLDIVNKLSPDVEIIGLDFNPFLNWVIWKLNAIIRFINPDFQVREYIRAIHFRYLCNKYQIDLVNSHWFVVDRFVAKSLANSPTKLVVTSHGSYEIDSENPFYKFGFKQGLKEIFKKAGGFVYLTDKNKWVFHHVTPNKDIIIKKIYNGYDGKLSEDSGTRTRLQLQIDPGAFVFGMVARGDKDKGWDEAIESTIYLREEKKLPVHLILVGSGEHLSWLEAKFQHLEYFHFVGFSPNPLDWINLFDLGLLPSPLENLPTVIIEYLYLNKPVIASQVGEIRCMLQVGGELAGDLISVVDGKPSLDELKQLMQEYVLNRLKYEAKVKLAGRAFNKFAMLKCITEYEKVFAEVSRKGQDFKNKN